MRNNVGDFSVDTEEPIYDDSSHKVVTVKPGHYSYSGPKISMFWNHGGLPKGFYSAYDSEASYWRSIARVYDDSQHQEIMPVFDEMIQTLYQKKRMTDQYVVYLTKNADYRVMKESYMDKVQEVWSRFVQSEIPDDARESKEQWDMHPYEEGAPGCNDCHAPVAFMPSMPAGVVLTPEQQKMAEEAEKEFRENPGSICRKDEGFGGSTTEKRSRS